MQCTDTTEKLLWILLMLNTTLPTCVCCCCIRLIAPQVHRPSTASLTWQGLSNATLSQWWWLCCQKQICIAILLHSASTTALAVNIPTHPALKIALIHCFTNTWVHRTDRDCKYDESSCLGLECHYSEVYWRGSGCCCTEGNVTVTKVSDFHHVSLWILKGSQQPFLMLV